MANASFLQSTFLGGVWSPNIQGNMHSQAYKTALQTSENYYPVEEGALTRRQGTRYLGPTRGGKAGRLIAFDFSIIQPYQMEFTDGYLRMYAGFSLVTENADLFVADISTATPAEVTTYTAHGLSNGDQIIYFANSLPCSAPKLAGRQLVITSTGTNTFTIADAVTGEDIDGSTLNFTADPTSPDKVKQIFELATPWTSGSWSSLRAVSNDENVILLHDSIAPRVLTQGVSPAPFALNTATFLDGPYLDINSTSTTLSASGTTGSITLTASSTTGINDGAGFQSTDVGRFVRIQGGPAIWDSGTTYAKGDVVTGSDSNVYQSNVASNLNHDPTTDGGVNWTLGTTGVVWTWLTITAVTDTTHVTATIEGADLETTAATPVWRLGLFSDTTGWPTAGIYHEGRLWLTGVLGNRIDGGTANNVNVQTGAVYPAGTFNFAPTGPDGTVADANAIAATANATDVNAIFWMASDSQGLILGTQAGEWVLKASQLDDPLTPTSIQMRRFSTYGSADVEPVRANRELIFVQRQQRKLMELGYYPYGEVAGYYAPNMAKFASHLVADGIAEVRWQPDQTPIIWVRTLANELVGVTYKHAPSSGMGTADTFTAWHGPHLLGHGREVTSISTGPTYDSLSITLYMVTNQTDDTQPDYDIHWVEVLSPQFDDAIPDYGSYFVDGGGTPACGKRLSVANGDAVDGVEISGFPYLEGLTITPVIGGLDLGDYVVSGGAVTLPFGTPAAFTSTFFDAFNNGDTYGLWETDYSSVTEGSAVTPSISANSIGFWNDDADTEWAAAVPDPTNNRYYKLGKTGGLLTYDYTTFDLLDTKSAAALGISPWSSAGPVVIDNGFIYSNETADNTSVKFKLRISDGRRTTYGTASSSFSSSCSRNSSVYAFQMLPIWAGKYHYNVHVGTRSASVKNEISLMSTDDFNIVLNSCNQTDEDNASVTRGPYSLVKPFASFYVLGYPSSYGSGDTVGIYRGVVSSGPGIPFFGETTNPQAVTADYSFTKLGTIAPSDIDATWTTFSSVSAMVSDGSDDTLLFTAQSAAGPTNTIYLVKWNPRTMTAVWTTALSANEAPKVAGGGPLTGPMIGIVASGGSDPGFKIYDLATGSVLSTKTFNGIYLFLATPSFSEIDGTMITANLEWTWGTDPTFIGPWAIAHGSTGNNGVPAKLFLGLDGWTPPQTIAYPAPSSFGFTYTSKGQLLRPDYGEDAGARNGPAFGKKRRIHSASFGLYRTQGLSVGTDLTKLLAWRLTTDGNSPVNPPTFYSGISWDSLNDDYGFTSQIAWEQTRPYPALIQAIEGYIETQDK